jgi:hypothetical protein
MASADPLRNDARLPRRVSPRCHRSG